MELNINRLLMYSVKGLKQTRERCNNHRNDCITNVIKKYLKFNWKMNENYGTNNEKINCVKGLKQTRKRRQTDR